MQRYDIINHLIQQKQYKRYLEIGIERGDSFSQVELKDKTSIDPVVEFSPTYAVTSDEFFADIAKTLDPFDIIFIDGLHISEQADRDISNAIKHITPNGAVVLHDCNPWCEEVQAVPRKGADWTGDVWKSFVRFRHRCSAESLPWVARVVDADCGCGVITCGIADDVTAPPEELTYDWLENNRKAGLGLVDVNEFQTWIEIADEDVTDNQFNGQ